MKNWTLQKRVALGFTAVILISALICGYAAWRLAEIQQRAELIETDSIPSLHLTGEMNAFMDMDYAAILEYLQATDLPVVKEYQAALKQYQPDLEPDWVSLEGFLAARFFCQAAAKAGAGLTRESFLQAVDQTGSFDLGGLKSKFLSFMPPRHPRGISARDDFTQRRSAVTLRARHPFNTFSLR
jgi:Periplasmic binding protein